MPNCHKTVGQHSKRLNKNKQVCAAHRTTKKHEVDKWKMNCGCSNHDSRYGFPCVSKEILDPSQLDINHIDGNNNNRDPSNIEVLCKMCHTLITLRNEHHLQPKVERRPKLAETGLFAFAPLDGNSK